MKLINNVFPADAFSSNAVNSIYTIIILSLLIIIFNHNFYTYKLSC